MLGSWLRHASVASEIPKYHAEPHMCMQGGLGMCAWLFLGVLCVRTSQVNCCESSVIERTESNEHN